MPYSYYILKIRSEKPQKKQSTPKDNTKSYLFSKAGCLRGCPEIIRPVCGSDGITYDNECVFEIRKCNENTHLTIVHSGECQRREMYSFRSREKNFTITKPVCYEHGINVIGNRHQ